MIDYVLFFLPILAILGLVVIILIKSINKVKLNKGLKVFLLLLVLILTIIYFILSQSNPIQPIFYIFKFDSIDISNALAILSIVVDILIFILDNIKTPKMRFDYMELFSRGINQSNGHNTISACIYQSNDNSYYDNMVIHIEEATIYHVFIKYVFKDRSLFEKLKDDPKYCKKIRLSDIENKTIPIENVLGRSQFSFDFEDEESIVNSILNKDSENYEDRKLLVLSIKCKFYSNQIFSKIFKKISAKLHHKKKTKNVFLRLCSSDSDKYTYIIQPH